MREIHVEQVRDTVAALCIAACCHLGEDVVEALREALHKEESPYGIAVLEQLLENAAIASSEEMPVCQDTGMAVVFLELGQEVHLVGGDLETAVNAGVAKGYTQGRLRKSVLSPLERINTGDNTPAVLHLRLVPGERLRIIVAPKGFGSENMSRLAMLKPSQGVEGVKAFVLETMELAGANPCPPVILGVGIGGTMEYCCYMAKHALLRKLGEANKDVALAALEEELLVALNRTGIGPQGFGGRVTALAVHMESYPTHLASLPVAVNVQCNCARHKEAVL